MLAKQGFSCAVQPMSYYAFYWDSEWLKPHFCRSRTSAVRRSIWQHEFPLSAKSGQIEAKKNKPRMAGSRALLTLPDVIPDLSKSPKRTLAGSAMKICEVESECRLFKKRPYAVDPKPTPGVFSSTVCCNPEAAIR